MKKSSINLLEKLSREIIAEMSNKAAIGTWIDGLCAELGMPSDEESWDAVLGQFAKDQMLLELEQKLREVREKAPKVN